jgi:hypothetical protein
VNPGAWSNQLSWIVGIAGPSFVAGCRDAIGWPAAHEQRRIRRKGDPGEGERGRKGEGDIKRAALPMSEETGLSSHRGYVVGSPSTYTFPSSLPQTSGDYATVRASQGYNIAVAGGGPLEYGSLRPLSATARSDSSARWELLALSADRLTEDEMAQHGVGGV